MMADGAAEAALARLTAERRLPAEDVAHARAQARPGESAPHAAARLGLTPWESMGRAAAAALGWEWLDAAAVAALGPAPEGGPSAGFLRSRRAALATDAAGVVALLADPFDAELRRALTLALEATPRFAVAAPEALEALRAPAAAPPPAEAAAPGAPAEVAQALLESAARLGASDLHLEPSPQGGRARARVDGRMRTLMRLDRTVYDGAAARLMVQAALDVAERRLPQDGRARLTLAGRPVDLRLSTAPALDGLSVAVRLLDGAAAPEGLDALGFAPDYVAVLQAAAARPYGLFALTGPTGSGKTTTLHALLRGLTDETRKVMTVEDPVEYALPGAVQMQVRPEIGLSFASAQRTLLRHNPDVMMIGEIRDRESAAIAVQAALTGHLVLTTVHANTAAGAAIRLLDLGVEPFLLSAALIGAGAQRLARRLCPACRRPDAPSPAALERIGASGPGDWAVAPGCAACDGAGVAGRAPVAEAFLAGPAFADALREGAPSEARLAALARRDGAPALPEAALTLAREGRISLAEALRVAPPPAA